MSQTIASRNRLARLVCRLLHFRHHDLTPSGIHHYDGHCRKCGRRWFVWEG